MYQNSGLSGYTVAEGSLPNNNTIILGSQGPNFPVQWNPRYTYAVGYIFIYISAIANKRTAGGLWCEPRPVRRNESSSFPWTNRPALFSREDYAINKGGPRLPATPDANGRFQVNPQDHPDGLFICCPWVLFY